MSLVSPPEFDAFRVRLHFEPDSQESWDALDFFFDDPNGAFLANGRSHPEFLPRDL